MNHNSQIPDTNYTSRHILVIEDNLDSAETLQTFLEISGHRTSVAYDGKNGLATAREVKPEVIICDIGLKSELDGYEVAKQIKNDDRLKSVFLIALSGYGQPEDKIRSQAAGFDVHLVKPTDFDALLELLNNFDRQ